MIDVPKRLGGIVPEGRFHGSEIPRIQIGMPDRITDGLSLFGFGRHRYLVHYRTVGLTRCGFGPTLDICGKKMEFGCGEPW